MCVAHADVGPHAFRRASKRTCGNQRSECLATGSTGPVRRGQRSRQGQQRTRHRSQRDRKGYNQRYGHRCRRTIPDPGRGRCDGHRQFPGLQNRRSARRQPDIPRNHALRGQPGARRSGRHGPRHQARAQGPRLRGRRSEGRRSHQGQGDQRHQLAGGACAGPGGQPDGRRAFGIHAGHPAREHRNDRQQPAALRCRRRAPRQYELRQRRNLRRLRPRRRHFEHQPRRYREHVRAEGACGLGPLRQPGQPRRDPHHDQAGQCQGALQP